MQLPKNKYFIKKGFCIITKKRPSSEDLNKINIYLRLACQTGNTYARFEEYVAKLVFQIHMPFPGCSVNIYLPGLELDGVDKEVANSVPPEFLKSQKITITEPDKNSLPYVNNDCINTLFKCLDVENVLVVFKRVLMDTNVLFIS